jgi:hypothetical protein
MLRKASNLPLAPCMLPRNAARSLRVTPEASSLALRASSLGEEPETEPDMPIYPLEFRKRSEEKWKRRAGESGSTSRTAQTGKNRNDLAPQQNNGAILSDGLGCSQSGKDLSRSTPPSNNLSRNGLWRS